MTVIVWDGKTLAADRLSGDDWTKTGRATKIHRMRGHLVGVAGIAAFCREFLSWFERGADPADVPAFQRDKDDYVHALVINPERKVYVYSRSPYPLLRENEICAIGSGKEVAEAALYFGKTAKEAVEACNVICTGCGGGVDTLTLE
jgi:hypothetical protein